MNNYKLCFIISHRYYRSYESFIQYYVDNINKFYDNSLIIIVDNNSKYVDDIKILFINYKNVLFLINETECKFELGAYNVGINYIINNNLLDDYNYYIFTQDNFILKNKFDFNILKENNTLACALNVSNKGKEEYYNPVTLNILNKINLHNRIDELTLCWCSSFILNKDKVIQFLDITKDIIIKERSESCCSERYLSGILYYLNNYIMTSIDGDIEIENLKYDYWNCNPKEYDFNFKDRFFIKKIQHKCENNATDN
jgi:hypothetical protein